MGISCYQDKKRDCNANCAVFQEIKELPEIIAYLKPFLTNCGAINAKIIERLNGGKKARVSIDD